VKLFTLLFSFYVIWLTVQPCTDDIPGKAQTATIEFASPGTAHDSHSNDEGCSPLCSCSCCNAQFIINSYQQELSPLGFDERNLSSIPQPEDQEISFGFWQPPRLA